MVSNKSKFPHKQSLTFKFLYYLLVQWYPPGPRGPLAACFRGFPASKHLI